MLSVHTVCRTVKVGKLEECEDANKNKYKSIGFTVATKRNYSTSKTINGVTIKERPSDFIYCKAKGKTAEIIANNCSSKTADGKIVSRFLSITGIIEIYTSRRKMQITPVIDDVQRNIKINVQQPNAILLVQEVEFLDSKPKENDGSVTATFVKDDGQEDGAIVCDATYVTNNTQTTVKADTQPVIGSDVTPTDGSINLDSINLGGTSESVPDDGSCPF